MNAGGHLLNAYLPKIKHRLNQGSNKKFMSISNEKCEGADTKYAKEDNFNHIQSLFV